MKDKRRFPVGQLLLLVFFLIAGAYFGLTLYYTRVFGFQTWVNGIYCTGKTIEEANEELVQKSMIQEIILVNKDGLRSVIHLQDIEYSIDYKSQLGELLYDQNPFFWWSSQNTSSDTVLEPVISIHEALLHDSILQTQILILDGLKERKLEIYLGDNGYALYHGLEQVLNVDLVYQTVRATIFEGKANEINLVEAGCYEDLPLNQEAKDIHTLYKKIVAFQNCGIVYDMGDSLVPVSPNIVAGWLSKDKNGSFMLDEDGDLVWDESGIDTFIELLASEYDTYGSTRTFHTTQGEDVLIEGGTYGNQMDQETEKDYLKQAFLTDATEQHTPAYLKEVLVKGKEDIGDTYIEIDLTQQKMYYYEHGEQKISTDVVTGNTSRRNGTPSGVNFVYNKQKNRILRGEGYASPVKFWMPIKGSIGIHDASWRKDFGGDIYQKNGSHGCINTPSDIMPELYDMVEIGTPVVMYY